VAAQGDQGLHRCCGPHGNTRGSRGDKSGTPHSTPILLASIFTLVRRVPGVGGVRPPPGPLLLVGADRLHGLRGSPRADRCRRGYVAHVWSIRSPTARRYRLWMVNAASTHSCARLGVMCQASRTRSCCSIARTVHFCCSQQIHRRSSSAAWPTASPRAKPCSPTGECARLCMSTIDWACAEPGPPERWTQDGGQPHVLRRLAQGGAQRAVESPLPRRQRRRSMPAAAIHSHRYGMITLSQAGTRCQ